MTKILLYGVPGSGKTTAGILLAKELDIPLISGDYLRDVAQSEHTEAEDPFAYVGTCQAWAKFGKLTEENARQGLYAVRASMRPYIKTTITSKPDCVFEVASLDPHDYLDTGQLCLITSPNQQQHRKQFFRERAVSDDTESEFMAARLVREYLVDEAKINTIPIIVNDGTREHLVGQLKKAGLLKFEPATYGLDSNVRSQ